MTFAAQHYIILMLFCRKFYLYRKQLQLLAIRVLALCQIEFFYYNLINCVDLVLSGICFSITHKGRRAESRKVKEKKKRECSVTKLNIYLQHHTAHYR